MLNCSLCGEPVTILDAQTCIGGHVSHTRCENAYAEERAAFFAECDESEGFRDRVPMRRAAGSEMTKFEKGRAA